MATHIKPSIHLTCIFHIITSKAANKQDIIKELLGSIKNIKNTNIFQVHIPYLNQIHVHMNSCFTLLISLHHNTSTPMHQKHVQILMNAHVIHQSINPNHQSINSSM